MTDLTMKVSWEHIRVGDRVEFTTSGEFWPPRLEGTVQRVWGQQAVNLTIETDAGQTFVRLARNVVFLERPAPA